ncbi:MAG: hypothetical protein H6712_13185 [Myxococcales bacterium]|nr:hypothetical protein [Myxococcales bacterium]MCB9714814.1 hypothetical protein [Myxococcales bacterium]
MPSAEHQSLTRLLTEARGAFAAALALVGIELCGELEIRPGPDAVRDGGPSDLLPDGTLIAHRRDGEAEEAFVVDVQLRRDPSKPDTWVVYVSITRRRLRCPTTLVVVTPYQGVANWAAQPIEIGRGASLAAVVIGPRQIPPEVSLERAREVPTLATLAVVAHGRGPHAEHVGRVAIETIRYMLARNDDHTRYHADVVYAFLDDDVRRKLETEMEARIEGPPYSSYLRRLEAEGWERGQAEGWRRGQAEGQVRGQAIMLVHLIDGRGLRATEPQRARMLSCTDERLLQHWFDRAITASSVDEILAP